MNEILWLPVLVKVISTALIVVLTSALAEALGPALGGIVAGLPVSAGPTYVFLAMQHDSDFIAATALGSCAANAATGLLLIVYALRARAAGRYSLTVALIAWFAASVAIRPIPWTPTTVTLLNLLVYGGGFVLLSRAVPAAPEPVLIARRRAADLPLRAAAVAMFVATVVAASAVLGPRATGIAAVFPISLISLIAIVQRRIGPAAASLLAASAVRAMLGFGLMLLILHLTALPFGTAIALTVALFVSVVWSAGLLLLRRPAAPTRRIFSLLRRAPAALSTSTAHGRDIVG